MCVVLLARLAVAFEGVLLPRIFADDVTDVLVVLVANVLDDFRVLHQG